MSIIIPLLVIILPSSIGAYQLNKLLNNNEENLNFAIQYLKHFQEFAKSTYDRTMDSQLYSWLTEHSVRMQTIAGNLGEMIYRPPFANYMHPRYQLFLNVIPGMRTDTAHSTMIAAVEDSLIRYIGTRRQVGQQLLEEFRNPLHWFRRGINSIILFPFSLLQVFRVLPGSTIESLSNSSFMKLLSGIASLVTLISSIVTILDGWGSVRQVVSKFGIPII